MLHGPLQNPIHNKPILAANLADVAKIINAMAEIAPAQVVADTVVAFVKYKESQS
jgi:hypothetical protein